MTPTFAPIGPFDLKRIDQLVAANVVGLLIGSRGVKIRTALIWLAGAGFLIWSMLAGDSGGVFAALLFLLLIFLVAPLLRSNARSREIVISDNDDGLQIETGAVRTLYKWDRLGEARIVAGRLFAKIDANCALVIPLRATTSENLANLLETIHQRKSG